MSALYQVPHSLANAVLLSHALEFNTIWNYEKYTEIPLIFDPSLTLENDVELYKKVSCVRQKKGMANH